VSIVYINPGFGSLFQESNFSYQEGQNKKYTRCKQYIIPFSNIYWYDVYSNNKIFDWYIRFDVYTNLSNENTNDKKGFIRLLSDNHDLTVNIGSHNNIILTTNDSQLYEGQMDFDTIHSYELHLHSNAKEEQIDLWEGNKLLYTSKGKVIKWFDREQPMRVQVKNIIPILTDDVDYYAQFGTAISNIIIGDTRLGNLTCDILDTKIKTDWNQNGNVYQTNSVGKEITQNIKDLSKVDDINDIKSDKKAIYAVSISALKADCDTDIGNFIKFNVNNYTDSIKTLPHNEPKKGIQSEVLEVDPIEGVFWDYNTIQRDFKMKSGVGE